ncbi:MAG: response regulator [bacterium]
MFDDPELLAGFLDESRENLSIIEPDLLELEKNGDDTDPEIINRIFRAIHSIKGGAGFFGLENIGHLSHEMESLLSLLRDRKIVVTQELIDLLFDGFDIVKDLFSDLSASDKKDIEDVVQRVIHQREVSAGTASSTSKDKSPEAKSQADKAEPKKTPETESTRQTSPMESTGRGVSKQQLADLIESGRYVYHVALKNEWPSSGSVWVGEIERLGKVVSSTDLEGNPIDLAAAVDARKPLHMYYSTVLDPDLIAGGLQVSGDAFEQVTFETLESMKSDTVTTVPTPAPQKSMDDTEAALSAEEAEDVPEAGDVVPKGVEAAGEPGRSAESSEKSATPAESRVLADLRKRKTTNEKLRVSVNLLNDLMDLAGELVLARNQLGEVIRISDAGSQALQFSMQNVSWVTTEIQEKIMTLRMQPLSVLFSKFPRTVRDLSKKTGKQIVLETKGENVEVDKTIIELLVDPMTHLVRNAVDHGIETPEQRQKSGKSAQGNIRFEAYQEGGQVHIDIIDDGNGINPAKIAAKALENGQISKEALESMSEREKLRIIFMPGFSTVEQVSNLSGRGVGMDVVLKNIESLSGSVDIESKVGKGTRIGLILPLTLAIVKGLVFQVNGRKFIIPEINIDELVRVRVEDLKNKVNTVQGVEVLRLRDQLLPVLKLVNLLHLENGNPHASSDEKGSTEKQDAGETASVVRMQKGTVQFVIVRFGASLFAMQVSTVEAVDEIVVKPLPSFFQKMRFYSGATVLGDGSVALILDPAGMAGAVGVREFEDATAEAERTAEKEIEKLQETVSMLLFDNGTDERFAIPLQLISRIERIRKNDIEWINDNLYYQYRGEKLRLIMLHDMLPIARPKNPLDGDFGVLVPKTYKHPVGIVFRNIIDTIESTIELDTESIVAPGLFGSSILEEKITLMPNMYEIFDMVFPEETQFRKFGGKTTRPKTAKAPRVLIVDDTPFFRMMEKKYLESAGFRVKLAENGAEALEMLDRESFDAVVLDIIMPGMSGFEVMREIRKKSNLASLPVIAVTALDDETSRQQGKEAGFDNWEEKLDKERLVAKVWELLGVDVGNAKE